MTDLTSVPLPARDIAFCQMVGVSDPREAVFAYIGGTVSTPPKRVKGMTKTDLAVLRAAYQYMDPERMVTKDEAAQTFRDLAPNSTLATLLATAVETGMI